MTTRFQEIWLLDTLWKKIVTQNVEQILDTLFKTIADLHNHTPKEIPTCLSDTPWKSEALPNINMEIPGIEDKRLQTPGERRGITDAFLNIHYPCDSWTRVYTDDC